MTVSQTISEAKFLERTRIKLCKVESHSKIKSALAAYGIDETKLAEGWNILNRAIDTWEINDNKKLETRESKEAYRSKYKEVEKLFRRHRDLARILCKSNPEVQALLCVKEVYPLNYTSFCDKVKQFYSVIETNANVQNVLAEIKIMPEIATACLLKLENLLILRCKLDKNKEESKTTTARKDADLSEITEWMADLNSILKIATNNRSQGHEVSGMLTKG